MEEQFCTVWICLPNGYILRRVYKSIPEQVHPPLSIAIHKLVGWENIIGCDASD